MAKRPTKSSRHVRLLLQRQPGKDGQLPAVALSAERCLAMRTKTDTLYNAGCGDDPAPGGIPRTRLDVALPAGADRADPAPALLPQSLGQGERAVAVR